MKTTKALWLWTRWAALLALTAILAACGAAVTPDLEPPANLEPPARQASCDDLAISVLERGAGVHGAIVSDKLHMGGATAPATCMDPANQSLLAGLSVPDGRTEQAQQSQYYLIVIRYPGGNRLYVLSRRADGTSCVVDTNDECIARVTDLPDDFNLETLPEDIAPTIPAGRPAPPTVGPSPGDDETPPAPGPAPGDETPPAPSPPPGDGAPPPTAGTPPGAATSPQPSDAATGVTVGGPLLSWAAAPRALSYDVYWGAENTDLDTPINTSFTALRISASADLDAETVYYWRVDAKNEAGTTRGAVWSFTTAPAAAPPPAPVPAPPPAEETPAQPTISLSADQSVLEGDDGYFDVDFEVTLSSPVTAARDLHIFFKMGGGTATDGHFDLQMRVAEGVDWVDFSAHYEMEPCRNIPEGSPHRVCGPFSHGPVIIGDRVKEENETVFIEVIPHKGFPVTCGRCRAKLTIIDDD